MKHIGWMTLVLLCLFAMRGIQKNSPDMYARNLLRNAPTAFAGEAQVFDNNEMKHLSTLKKAIDLSASGRSGAISGEMEASEVRMPAEQR